MIFPSPAPAEPNKLSEAMGLPELIPHSLPPLPPLAVAPVGLPLLASQRRLLSQFGGRNEGPPVMTVFRVEEQLQIDALEAALGELIWAHQALRLRLVPTAVEWRQALGDIGGNAAVLFWHEIQSLSELDLKLKMASISNEAGRSLDSDQGPMLRIDYLDRGKNLSGYVLVTAHRLLMDTASWPLLMSDLEQAYRAAASGHASKLIPQGHSYLEAIAALGVEQDNADQTPAYWAAELANSANHGLVAREFSLGSNSFASQMSLHYQLSEQETANYLAAMKGEPLLLGILAHLRRMQLESKIDAKPLCVCVEADPRQWAPAGSFGKTLGNFSYSFPFALHASGDFDFEAQINVLADKWREVPARGYGFARALEQKDSGLSLSALPTMLLRESPVDRGSSTNFHLLHELPPTLRDSHLLRPYEHELHYAVLNGRLTFEWRFSSNLNREETVWRLVERLGILAREAGQAHVNAVASIHMEELKPEPKEEALDRLSSIETALKALQEEVKGLGQHIQGLVALMANMGDRALPPVEPEPTVELAVKEFARMEEPPATIELVAPEVIVLPPVLAVESLPPEPVPLEPLFKEVAPVAMVVEEKEAPEPIVIFQETLPTLPALEVSVPRPILSPAAIVAALQAQRKQEPKAIVEPIPEPLVLPPLQFTTPELVEEESQGAPPTLKEERPSEPISTMAPEVSIIAEPLHKSVERWAATAPQQTALICGSHSVSYGELNESANRLAHYIVGQGVASGDIVGIYLDKGEHMLVAVLAVLKVGAAFLSMDLCFPRERLAYLMEDSGAKLLLSQGRLVGRLPSNAKQHLLIDTMVNTLGRMSVENLTLPIAPDALAQVSYISHASGVPRGTYATHGELFTTVSAAIQCAGATSEDTWLLLHSLAAEFSALELWGALCSGGKLVIAAEQVAQSPTACTQLMKAHHVSVLVVSPTELCLLAETTEGVSYVKSVLVSGSLVSPSQLANWQKNLSPEEPQPTMHYFAMLPVPVFHLGNWSLTYCPPDQLNHLHCLASGVGAVVLGVDSLPVPLGGVGELYLGGEHVAHTLQNHPELATKTTGGEKLLRSGELARLKEAGCIELMGSRGSQVLLRGFRLELSEIESLLCARPDVLHCVVVPTVDWQGETTLDVFLTCQGVRKPTQWELRDYLGHYIPEFMTPSIYRILDHFPLTEDGRPDRTLIAGMVKPVR